MPASLSILLRILCSIFLSLLVIRSSIGPTHGLISTRSTLNMAAFAFLTLLAILFSNRPTASTTNQRIPPIIPFAVGLAAIAPFLLTLNAPFVFDDYFHLTAASARESLPALLNRILRQHPTGGDGFFRPFGLLYYWLVFKFAGWSTIAWHACGLLLHAANTLLVFVLLNRLSRSATASTLGALLFAWHASHVEPENRS